MKHLDTSISHTRRVLCTTTLLLLAGAVTAIAQSGSGSGSAGAGSGSSGGAGSGSYNQSSGTTGTSANETARRNSQMSGSSTSGTSGNSTSGNTSGAYGTSTSGNTSGSYGTSTSGNTSTSGTYGTSAGSSTRDRSATTTATGSMSGNQSGKLSWSDKRFVTKAADHGKSEVAIAQLAAQQASNPEVRRFAQRLVQDHTRVNQELMSLASSKNVELDQDNDQDRTYRRLSNRQGQDFDREFIEQMVDMHEADVKMFEKASEDAKDQELRSFASRHVGHLREHLQQAQSLRSSIMPTGRDSDTSGGARATTSGSAGDANTSAAIGSTGGSNETMYESPGSRTSGDTSSSSATDSNRDQQRDSGTSGTRSNR